MLRKIRKLTAWQCDKKNWSDSRLAPLNRSQDTPGRWANTPSNLLIFAQNEFLPRNHLTTGHFWSWKFARCVMMKLDQSATSHVPSSVVDGTDTKACWQVQKAKFLMQRNHKVLKAAFQFTRPTRPSTAFVSFVALYVGSLVGSGYLFL